MSRVAGETGGATSFFTRESKGFSMVTALDLCSGSPSLDPGAGDGIVTAPAPLPLQPPVSWPNVGRPLAQQGDRRWVWGPCRGCAVPALRAH
jgi:hypothetical protein